MVTWARRSLFWAPRALTIAFAGFLSLFALDVFNEGYSFWKTLAALGIHLIPTALVLVVLAIAWRWEWLGAAAYAGLAAWYVKGAWRHPDWVATIAGPLVAIGALFLLNWLWRAELRGTKGRAT